MIVCTDSGSLGGERRIVIHDDTGEIEFIDCLWPNRFWAFGPESRIQFSLKDVTSVIEAGVGDFQRLTITTHHGRCVISPVWKGYKKLRSRLRDECPHNSGASLFDDPRLLLPVFLVMVFFIVGLIIWMML